MTTGSCGSERVHIVCVCVRASVCECMRVCVCTCVYVCVRIWEFMRSGVCLRGTVFFIYKLILRAAILDIISIMIII